MLVYLPSATKEQQDKAYDYALDLLNDPLQREHIPWDSGPANILGGLDDKAETYQELLKYQNFHQDKYHVTINEYGSFNANGDCIGLMGYLVSLCEGSLCGWGPWLARKTDAYDDMFTYGKDVQGIYKQAIKSSHYLYCGVAEGYLNTRQRQMTTRKDGTDSFMRNVVQRYETVGNMVVTRTKNADGVEREQRAVLLVGGAIETPLSQATSIEVLEKHYQIPELWM
ncbi:hypothetical protein VPHD479_0269 [Vibrio phage D479]